MFANSCVDDLTSYSNSELYCGKWSTKSLLSSRSLSVLVPVIELHDSVKISVRNQLIKPHGIIVMRLLFLSLRLSFFLMILILWLLLKRGKIETVNNVDSVTSSFHHVY
mmetsp:Transcript_1201/g.1535  ORF Transcript_1201/g.1535 Transcript_1201/m.1535 type:complete len:109 (-) Transcript_1201:716-1042(-)